MALTTQQLAAALKGTHQLKAGRHFMGNNLVLHVSNTGAMSWLFRYKKAGRKREIGLGSFTGHGSTYRVTLADARIAADEIRVAIAKGLDPKAEKQKAALAERATFTTMLDEYLNKRSVTWVADDDGTSRQAETWRTSLATHAATIMTRPVDQIDRADVLAIVNGLWDRPLGETIRARIENVLDYAKGVGHRDGMDNPATWTSLQHVLVAKPGRKGGVNGGHIAMAYGDVPAFMKTLLPGEGMAAKGLAFTILTAVRTKESRLARWDEIDFEAKTWTVPAERMKGKKDERVEHIVPLSDAAIDVLRSIPRIDDNPHVFAGKVRNKPVGPTAFSDKLTDPADKGGLGYAGEATVHGFRSSFRDFIGDETGFARDDVEMCLAHRVKGTEGAYRRTTAVEKRRQIMQAWANHCMGRSNVEALKVAA